MLVNIIKSYREILTICDSELLGKCFEEGLFQLNIKENFYKGERKTEQEVIQIILDMKMEDATFNIIGERSTNCAVKAGLVSKDSIKTIQGVPFVLILM